MFWTLGPKAVGKATLAGWRDAIKPALADRRARYAIWPFDGPLSELVETFDAVIVETYPAEFYRRLGLRIGTAGHSKTSPEARQATASALLAWCTEHGIVPDDDLAGQILDGFGAGKEGEDPFDAVVGLLGMVATIRGASEPELPDDPAIRQVEGWMFGQPVPSPLDPTPAPQADAAAKPQISSKRVALPDPELVTEPRGDVARRVTAEHLDGIVVGEDGVARCWWAEFSPRRVATTTRNGAYRTTATNSCSTSSASRSFRAAFHG